MELNIYNKDGSLKLTVSPSDSSTVTEEVGGECSVSLSFDTFEFRPIEVNDYIEVAGVRYKARMAYRPKMKNRQSYSYSLRFYAPIHDAEQVLMKTETDGGLISEFSLWGGPREHLQKWVDNMNRLAGSDLWTIGSVITGENKNIDYQNVNCWDAAFGSNGIAATYETEMWADGYVINLCKCERGERVTLGYGNGLTGLTPEDNSDKVRFFTRLYPLGSTRNIDVSTYGFSRLQLPSRATFVDHNTDRYGVFEDSEEAAFADIYPQYIGTVSAVRSEPKTDENGKQFTVYYIKDDGMTWEPQALPEKTFMLSFQTGDLQGYGDDTDKSFQAEWHKDTKEWEIINIWLDENTQVPGGNIVPVVGNQYFPWNMIMPQEYITDAQNRYAAAVNDFVANYSGEPVAYSGSTDYIHCAKQAVPLRIGQNVRLESDLYFEDGYQNTRITKVVRKLCRLTDATVTFAEQIGTGWKKSVDNQLSSLHYEMQRQAEQAGIDMIKTTDTKTPSDNNVFSALRSLATFLRKDKADSTSNLLTLLAGAVFGDNKASIGADGVAKFLSAVFNGGKASIGSDGAAKLLSAVFNGGKASIAADGASKFLSTIINGGKASIDADGLLTVINAIVKGDIKSDNFLAGVLGSGYAILKKDADGKSYLEVDKLFARVKAIFAVLEIMKVTYTGGNFVFSPAGMQCTKVEEYESFYRCFFTVDDGEKAVENTFEVDDFVQLREFNVKPGVYENVSNRYFWRRCIAKGSDYIDLSKSDRDMTSDDAPMAGDSLVTIGNKTIKSRQNVIIISVYGEGSPSIIQYAGVSDYSLDNKAVTVISPDGNKFTGSFVIEATGKSVEDELSTAVEVADAAKKAAEQAQKDADAANTELKTIASDSYITPSEKTALKQQQADIQAERNEIIANAIRYGVSTTAYSSAYTAANNALTKYTASSPQNIQVGTDYANISAYYAARKTILDAIATAAKKLVENVDDDLQSYKSTVTQEFEAVDGRFTSAINETKKYTDNAIGNVQIGGRNILRNSGEKITPNSTDYLIHTYESAVQFKPGGKYTVVIKGSTSAGQKFGLWVNGDQINVGFFSEYMKGEVAYKQITMPSNIGTPSVSILRVYNYPNPNGVSKPCQIKWIAMYEGHIKPPMDWSPAPEDLTTKIEENSSKIEQLPDQITLQVKKDVTAGGLNYIANTQNSITVSGTNEQYQVVGNNWILKKAIANKKFGCAYKIKFEGCTFGTNANFILRTDVGGGWNNTILVPQKSISSNGEYILYSNSNTAINATQDVTVSVRISYVSGGKITISEIRAYDVAEGLVGAFPWYPSKWDTEQLSSEIKQTADSITLAVSETKKYTDNAVGNIRVGGRNYIRNSAFADTSIWGANGVTIAVDKSNKRNSINSLKITQNTASDSGLATIRIYQNATKLSTASLSFWAKANKTVSLKIRLGSNQADMKTVSLTTSWQRYVFENVTPESEAVIFGALTACTWWLSEPMLVEGSKASDWSPAPEDISEKVEENNTQINQNAKEIALKASQASVNTLSGRVSTAEANISVQAGQIASKASQTSVDSLTGRVTRAESEIKQTAESISLKVNQSIGGENLIDNSSFSENIKGWNLNGDSGNIAASIVNTTALGSCLSLFTKQTYAGLFRAISEQYKGIIEPEAVFTVSFDLYKTSSNPSQLEVGFEDGGGSESNTINIQNHPLNTWKRVSLTQTLKTSRRTIVIYSLTSSASTVYIKNFKVERGSKATEWTPSGNETLLSTGIDVMNKKIDITADKLSIKTNSGKSVAVFDGTGDVPKLKADYIDVENLSVSLLETKNTTVPVKLYVNGEESTINYWGLDTIGLQTYRLDATMGGINDSDGKGLIGAYWKINGYRKMSSLGDMKKLYAIFSNEEIVMIDKGNNCRCRISPKCIMLDFLSQVDGSVYRSYAFGISGTQIYAEGKYYSGYNGTLQGQLVRDGIICSNNPLVSPYYEIDENNYLT